MGRLGTGLTSAASVVAGSLMGGFGSQVITLAALFGGFLAFIVSVWVVAIKSRAWFHHESMPMKALFPFGNVRPEARIAWSRATRLLLCAGLFTFSVALGVLVRASG